VAINRKIKKIYSEKKQKWLKKPIWTKILFGMAPSFFHNHAFNEYTLHI